MGLWGANAAWAEGGPVILAQHPGTELDRQARLLVSPDLHDAAMQNERPVLLTGSGHLSDDPARTALFVQLQSASLCGSAGCSTSVYLPDGRKWIQILDSVSGPITIAPEMHEGMHDLLVDGTDRWIWNGSTYTDTQATAEPAPPR
ncbi:hypothetical protein CFR77_08025 [Komagataeibacter sucrofermentans]|uniref:Uncharacterized protein n=2 Tax=Komagataeibacter sucrofermentans TaxID=1053551 RepID=A0A318QI42_9PROT|nr:hypothetical protein [Komagataeibacter sucrofermentans]PYD79347.1 hypothetical protein CFR77_08025 [Komagataeibacter sucrofermentans]